MKSAGKRVVDFARLIVANRHGQPIRIQDIGTVTDGNDALGPADLERPAIGLGGGGAIVQAIAGFALLVGQHDQRFATGHAPPPGLLDICPGVVPQQGASAGCLSNRLASRTPVSRP